MKTSLQVLSYKFGATAFDPKIYKKAVNIVNKLKENNHTAFFVGGCVRDVLLGKRPQEIDLTTSATPDDIQKLFDKVHLVGARFGVCVVNMDGDDFEVSTFRKDSPYQDGRRPEYVTFSDPEEDALRRDFTMNALFWEPIESKLYDYVGGLDDLHSGIIRAVGDPMERFGEDRLRIIRCARFLSQLNFSIHRDTYEAMFKIKDPMKGISAERLRDEIEKILMTQRPSIAINILSEIEVLKNIIPELISMKGIPQPFEFHPEGDVWVHTMIALDIAAKEFNERDNILMWAVLLHDVGKPKTLMLPKDNKDRIRFNGHDVEGEKMARQILSRLKLSKKEIDAVCYMIKNHIRLGKANEMRKGRLKLLVAKNTFSNELRLCYADIMASHKDLSIWEFLKKEYEEFQKTSKLPDAIVDGDFLISLGLTPSPLFNRIIKNAYEAQLDGSFTDVEGAKKFIKSSLPK
ncbi:MAG: CCA tRNA nucleotidyltransferase [Pseudomonadota bacterium]